MATKPTCSELVESKTHTPTIITILVALHLSRVLYKSANHFMNTNPICRNAKMNITKVLTRNYENQPLSDMPKTNPIQTQLNPIKANFKPNLLNAQMTITKVLTKDYENQPLCDAPKQTQSNPPVVSLSNLTCSELVESISPPKTLILTHNPAFFCKSHLSV